MKPLIAAVVVGIFVTTAAGGARAAQDDKNEVRAIYSAGTEAEIVAWYDALSIKYVGKLYAVSTKKIDLPAGDGADAGDKLLVVICANQATSSYHTDVYVYAGRERTAKAGSGDAAKQGWAFVMCRQTSAADVKVEEDKKAKRVRFLNKSGEEFMTLPLLNFPAFEDPATLPHLK